MLRFVVLSNCAVKGQPAVYARMAQFIRYRRCMEHFQAIYALRAAEYHQMIAAEDLDGRLLPALERVASLRAKRVIDLGTGTGRLPLLIGGRAAQVIGLDSTSRYAPA